MNINDLKYAVINVTGLSINDEYFVWLGVNGGTGNALPDREFSYLISLGGIPGSINDMWFDLLRASGYEGSLNDMLWDFWNNGGNFTLPIMNMQNLGLVHDAAGGDLVSGRSTPATFTDYEGRVVDVLANENRFVGANRIHNLTAGSAFGGTLATYWANTGGTLTQSTDYPNEYSGLVLKFLGSAIAHRWYNEALVRPVVSEGDLVILTVEARGSGVISLWISDGGDYFKEITLTDKWVKYSFTHTMSADSVGLPFGMRLETNNAVTCYAKTVLTEINVSAPNNYVDSDTIYNAGVPGVFYSAFESANTVDANGVVTEVQGALIFPAPTLMYEPAATNLLGHSFEFDHADYVGATVPTPIPLTDGYTFDEGNTSNTHYLLSDNSLVLTATEYTISIIAKAGTSTVLQITGRGGAFAADVYANFDLTNGILGSKGAGITRHVITAIPNSGGKYLCEITATTIGGATSWAIAHVDNNSSAIRGPSYLGLSRTMTIYSSQIETGAFSTSHIRTTTVAVTRDADSPNLPLVVGTNFVQEQGMAIFRFKPGYDQFDNTAHYGLLGLKNSTASFLFDTATFNTPRVSSFDGSTELVSEVMGSGWLKDDDVIIVLTFSNSESLYSINYSLDGGAVFGNWTDAAYDGSFELEGLLYRFFLQQAFPNELIATQVYGSLPGDTIADAKTWLEANAQTATGG